MRAPTQDYLDASTSIEAHDIEAHFIRLPADLAYWSGQYADAYKDWKDAELRLEQIAAQLSLTIRDQLVAENKGRVTVAEVEQVLHASQPYVDARAAENVTEARKVRLHGIVGAIQAKKEMLISLGAHMRAEMGHDPAIRTQTRIEREVAEARRVQPAAVAMTDDDFGP